MSVASAPRLVVSVAIAGFSRQRRAIPSRATRRSVASSVDASPVGSRSGRSWPTMSVHSWSSFVPASLIDSRMGALSGWEVKSAS